MATGTTAQLQQLLAPPSTNESQQLAVQLVLGALPKPLTPTKLAEALTPLYTKHSAQNQRLQHDLAASTARINSLLGSTNEQLNSILTRTKELKSNHESLEDALIDHREQLVSSVAIKENTFAGAGAGEVTLKEKLQSYSQRRKQLKLAQQWFAVLAKTEQLGIDSLRALVAERNLEAFSNYVELVDYIKEIHSGASQLALVAHLVAMASSVWNQLVKTLSERLATKLEALGWPTSPKEPLDGYDSVTQEFRASFADLLALEKIQFNHPLPKLGNQIEQEGEEENSAAKPLIALIPLVEPLLLRFRWHFHGDRNTNRIDKPEYPLSHVLNLLTAHDQFMSTEIQNLLDTNGFEDVDAIIDFTSLLLPSLETRLRRHMPQLIEMPPVLAHTIYQTLEFDQVLRSRNYKPRGLSGEWKGLSEIILGHKEWAEAWLAGEREFFDTRYYAAISAADAWQIISAEDFDTSELRSDLRPTSSAVAVTELAQQITDRYKPLPSRYALPFLFLLQLPLLSAYADRITSSLDAFESLSFGLLPGALSTNNSATAGVGGVVRIARACVSAKWMAEKCSGWGEDAFFLALYDFVTSTTLDAQILPAAQQVLEESEGTLFDRQRKSFEFQADRAQDLIVKHVVKEVSHELKPYLGRRWDFDAPAEEDSDLSLTAGLTAPLSLLQSLLSTLVKSFPSATSTILYRRIAVGLSTWLYDRLLISRAWSEAGAHQFNFDLENGFLLAAREAGIVRGVRKGWELLIGGGKIMALPASASTSNNTKSSASAYEPAKISFGKVMGMAWDDAIPEGEGTEWNQLMEQLGVGEVVGKTQVQQIMRRRPECWR